MKGVKKGCWVKGFGICCQVLPHFQSLAPWTEDWQGLFFLNDVRLPGDIPGVFVAI